MADSQFKLDRLVAPQSLAPLGTLGVGGTGWVIEAKCARRRVACKILRPDIAEAPAFAELRTAFRREAARLAQNRHSALVDVLGQGVMKYGTGKSAVECPYFVMPYVKGSSLCDWISRVRGSASEKFLGLVRVGRTLLDVLAFLHGRKLVHMDVKSNNIMVSGKHEAPVVTLMDLGLAQKVSKNGRQCYRLSLENRPNRVPIVHLTNPDRTVVELEELPYSLDLHCFQHTMREAAEAARLSVADVSERFIEEARFFDAWLTRMDWNSPEPRHPFEDASAAQKDAEKAYGWPKPPSVLFGFGNLRLPVCDIAHFNSERLKHVIDTEDFQRLRRLRQLGMVHYIYPGATHSRFEHSLGCFSAAIDYLKGITTSASHKFRSLLDDESVIMTAAMALLHDVGHYPFSHQLNEVALPGFPSHEEVGYEMIRDSFASRVAAGYGIDSQRLKAFAGCLMAHPDADSVQEDNAEPTWRALRQVIDGPIDVDKFDYLRRDATHCGVTYLSSLDVERFLQALTVEEDDEGFFLGVREKGISSAEMFAVGRYFMYVAVYYNHGVRHLDRRLQECAAASRNPSALYRQIRGMSDDEALRVIIEGARKKGVPAANDLTDRLGWFWRLTVIRRDEDPTLHEALTHLSFDSRRTLEKVARSFLRDKGLGNYREGELLIDLPEPKRQDPIKFVDDRGRTVERSHPLWKSVQESFDSVARRIRVFVCGKRGEQLKEIRKKQLIAALRAAAKRLS